MPLATTNKAQAESRLPLARITVSCKLSDLVGGAPLPEDPISFMESPDNPSHLGLGLASLGLTFTRLALQEVD